MMDFIDKEQESYGVEPICKALPTTPPYLGYKYLFLNPEQGCSNVKRDEELIVDIHRV